MDLLMYQAVRRDDVIRVPCRIYACDDPRAGPTGRPVSQWPADDYDQLFIEQFCLLFIVLWLQDPTAVFDAITACTKYNSVQCLSLIHI